MTVNDWKTTRGTIRSASDGKRDGGCSMADAVDGLESVHGLVDIWKSSACQLDSPIQDLIWSKAALETISAGDQLRVFVHREPDGSFAIAPLTQSPESPRLLNMLGVRRLGEPMEFLYTDAAALAGLANKLCRERCAIVLERVFADSPVIAALKQAFKGRGWVHLVPQGACPYIPLDEGWLEPEQRFNAGRRSDFRRARRRAEALGAVTFEIHAPTSNELDSLLAEAFRVEGLGWKGVRGSSLQRDEPLGEFYRRYARMACEQGILRIGFMRIAGTAVAMQIAAEHAGRFWLLKVGYDESYARCSPGQLLMLHTLRYAAERGCLSYEFLGYAESWTNVWTPLKRDCVEVRVYPFNRSGLTNFLPRLKQSVLRRARPIRRRAARFIDRRLPERVRQAYIAGPKLEDAIAACHKFAGQGIASTVGYWNEADEDSRSVTDAYLATVAAVSAEGLDSYVSVKAPTVAFSSALMTEVVEQARQASVGIHFDSLGPEAADATFEMITSAVQGFPRIGCTLPGRWRRSLDDAQRAVKLGLNVRVVKGQWKDPDAPDIDLRQGYLAVIERLAGGARHVAVATHDAWLVREALRRLQAAGTSCEVELLYGLPTAAARAVAREMGVGVRLYVPYGEAYLPYALSQAVRKPHIVAWILRDTVIRALRRVLGRDEF